MCFLIDFFKCFICVFKLLFCVFTLQCCSHFNVFHVNVHSWKMEQEDRATSLEKVVVSNGMLWNMLYFFVEYVWLYMFVCFEYVWLCDLFLHVIFVQVEIFLKLNHMFWISLLMILNMILILFWFHFLQILCMQVS